MYLAQIFQFVLFGIVCSVSNCDTTSEKISNAVNCFTLDLYETMPKDNRNVAISPLAVDMILSILLLGAKGSTAKELSHALFYEDQGISTADVETAYKTNLDELVSTDGNSLSIANSLWPSANVMLGEKFTESVDGYVRVQSLDYNGDPIGATNTINKWLYSHSKKTLKSTFEENLSSSTVLALTNVIHYKGQWKQKFPTNQTINRTVSNSDGTKVVPVMHLKSKYKYKVDDHLDAQVLELDYAGGDLSFIAVIPKSDSKLEDLEKKFKCPYVTGGYRSTSETDIDLVFAKFNISCYFNLVKTLKKLDVTHTFGKKPDFSAIADNIRFSAFVQRVTFEVDETGTRFKAASGVGVVDGVTEEKDQATFKAESPFLYLIRHNPTNIFMFIGRVVAF